MSFQWRILSLVVFILVLLLVGCRVSGGDDRSHPVESETAAANSDEAAEEESDPFRPYGYTEVPELKQLIFSEGFKQYTTEKPYLLGFSYDGDYVATIIYDHHQQGYIVEVTDTVTNHVTYEAYVPDEERILKGEQVSVDLLQTAQESLNMGYRIKVTPIINEQKEDVFEQQGRNNDTYRFQMSVEDGKFFRISVRDEEDHTWLVVNDRTPLASKQQLIHTYTWAIHPRVPDRVNIMVYTEQEERAIKPYIYTVNTALLERQMSEEALKETLSEWLKEPKIVYRYPSTANVHSVLAVETEGEEENHGSPLYAGTVSQFVLLDHEGNKLAHADAEGVYDEEDETLSSPGDSLYYDVVLVPGMEKKEAELFVVDVYSEGDQLLQTLEWKWSERRGKFQFIQSEEND